MDKKYILFLLIFGVLLIAACKKGPVACTEDARLCSDGTAVGRVGPDCEFAKCPTVDCDYDNPDMEYVGESQEECDEIDFICREGKIGFSDECGCGCKSIEDQDTCIATGGKWEQISNLPGSGPECNAATIDVGNECSDSTECESYCAAEDGAEVGTESVGTCHGFMKAVCMQEVVDGIVSAQWCI